MSDAESLGSSAMEEDEDDLYGDAAPHAHNKQPARQEDDKDGDIASDEDYESDDSIEIITEKPDGGEEITIQTSKPVSQVVTITDPRTVQTTVTTQVDSSSSKQDGTQSRAQVTFQSGKAYPEIRSSKIDVNSNPVFPAAGKPVTDIEIDADLAENEKPWRRPGADQSDYFNYGFDEFTWSTYCLRQKSMSQALSEQKSENRQFEQMFGGGAGAGGMMPGMPAMPSMGGGAMPDPSAMAAMMGMPPNGDMFQMMQQAMAEQGINDVSQLDFASVMAKMQGGGGSGGMGQAVPSGPAAQQQQQGYGGGNWQQQGGYGRGNKRGGRW